jgi:protein O-mannosyl-transferase
MKFHFLALFLHIAVGLLLYTHTLKYPFVFDDKRNITGNSYIRLKQLDFDSLCRSATNSVLASRPVANLSFALNYYFSEYNPGPYRLVNIVIHIVNGLLVYCLALLTLTLTFPNPISSNNRTIIGASLCSSLIWLVHPVQTQSVTYVVQRMNSLSALFYLASLCSFISGRLSQSTYRRLAYWAFCFCFGLLSLGTKEIAATLPIVILLYEWYFFRDLSLSWLQGNIKLLAVPVILFLLITLLYLGENPVEKILGGYSNRNFTAGERVLTQFRVIVFYLSLLIYPHPDRLNLDHFFSVSSSLVNPASTGISSALILFFLWLGYRLGRSGKRLSSFCIIWFFINLLIESSILPLELAFDHRLYLPSIGVALLSVPLFLRLTPARPGYLTLIVPVSIILILSLWTHQRNKVWKDAFALWSDCAAKSPKKARPHNNLGNTVREQGNNNAAIVHYLTAMRLDPNYAKPYYNLGNILLEQGKTEQAIRRFQQALRLEPGYEEAHLSLGAARQRQGDLEAAMRHYLEASRIRPGYAEAHNNIGYVLSLQGNFDAAIHHYVQALKAKPDYAGAHGNMGIALANQGRMDDAIKHFSAAVSIDPGDDRSRNNLEIALRSTNKDIKNKTFE